MTNKELQELLKKFPDDIEVRTEYDSSYNEMTETSLTTDTVDGKTILVIW